MAPAVEPFSLVSRCFLPYRLPAAYRIICRPFSKTASAGKPSIAESATYPLSAGQSVAIDFLSPAAGCDIHGQNCGELAGPEYQCLRLDPGAVCLRQPGFFERHCQSSTNLVGERGKPDLRLANHRTRNAGRQSVERARGGERKSDRESADYSAGVGRPRESGIVGDYGARNTLR